MNSTLGSVVPLAMFSLIQSLIGSKRALARLSGPLPRWHTLSRSVVFMFVFGFARDAKTRRPVGANFLEAVQVLGVVVLILSILRLFCLWLCQKLQNANYFSPFFFLRHLFWYTQSLHVWALHLSQSLRIVWIVLCAVQLRNCPLVGPAGGPSAQSGGNVAIQKLSRNILFYHVHSV